MVPRVPVRLPAGRRRVSAALVALVVVVAAAMIEGHGISAAGRGYSTYGARVVDYSLTSRLLERRLDEVGIIPPGSARRPLLVLLHGRHDDPRRSSAAATKSGPESMLNDALFAGLAGLGPEAPIVVLLNGGRHTWYHDRRYGRWASMILDEAIPDAIRRFHARPDRIAIGGISMGGYGALHLAALRPHEFCAVGGHSAALYESFRTSPPVAFDDAADFTRNNVFASARRGRFDRVPVWLDVGSSDPFHPTDGAFAAVLRSRGVHVAYHVWPGGHTTSYWRTHMAEYLGFYASALATCSS
jgi:S-formylglutathione hydrolase FrmB